ncbi:hypothetical protein GCM10010486_38410 [Nonomuraea roseoviolacea subsp. carminata]
MTSPGQAVLRADLLGIGDFLAFDPTENAPFAIAPADPESRGENSSRVWGQIVHVVSHGRDWRPCTPCRAEIWFTCQFDQSGTATLIVGVKKDERLLIRQKDAPVWPDCIPSKPPWEF